MREIQLVVMSKYNGERETLVASDKFRYEETPNGIVMVHGKSRTLFPWHRILSVDYVRESGTEFPLL